VIRLRQPSPRYDVIELWIADSESELLEFTTQYLKDYHPMGYDTRVSKPVQRNGKWECRSQRYASCD
jgi:hypothetical protein